MNSIALKNFSKYNDVKFDSMDCLLKLTSMARSLLLLNKIVLQKTIKS